MEIPNLSPKAKALWEKTLQKTNNKKVALEVVKKSKTQSKYKAKAELCGIRKYHAKSSMCDQTSYFADIILGDIAKDNDGDEVPVNSLHIRLDGMEGDLEHANLFNRNEVSHDKLFKIIDSFFDGTRNLATIQFYSEHPQFKDVWDFCEQGEFGASLEYNEDWKVVGVTGTIKPKNTRSKVINVYTK